MGNLQFPQSGNGLIDEGHEHLMVLLAEIGGHLRQPNGRPEAIALFSDFLNALRNHLGLEEVILRTNGYSQLNNHARRHTQLIDRVTEMVETLTYAPSVHPLEVLDRVSDLLIEHEMVEDSDIWPCLAKQDSLQPTTWGAEMETGIEQIDEHHKAMIEYMTRLHNMSDDAPLEDIAQVLNSLRSLAIVHFELEESLWTDQCGDQKANNAHAKAHVEILETLDEMTPRLQTGEIALSTFVDGFLTDWLINHILRVDQPHIALFNSGAAFSDEAAATLKNRKDKAAIQ
ncbi:hemerythrin domain-containing protein [Rhodospirillum sp. A1_3_36]|uniref:hemerythrin domain-containing protein n=1 Tax=Rhodospirillum sp. A1_3_36 TaxID=3391666 RepID=UPI0039A5DBFC